MKTRRRARMAWPRLCRLLLLMLMLAVRAATTCRAHFSPLSSSSAIAMI